MSREHRRIKAVLFDLGGTVIKTAPVPETLTRILEANGVRRPLSEIESAQRETEKELTPRDYTLPSDKFWTQWNMGILSRLRLQENQQYLSRVIGERWWDFADLELYPDAKEILSHLKQHRFKTGIVTNGFRSDIDEILPRIGLSGYFDVTVGIDAVGKPKPNSEIFLFALDRLDVHPHETIFVGDILEIDYEGAERAGITPVLIDREAKAKPSVTKIGSLTELRRYLR